ncbi:MAG: DNA repair protein RecN [Pyrinomonadaceae bacterium]|nr:DNA repair protein RecN [Pyrinomonadaceae bacterium]
MLSLLKIKNIALIDELAIEFGEGLNLLTGETGSGKSIIVDSLGALTGDRVSNDLIKEGEQSASIEGLFAVNISDELRAMLGDGGVQIDDEMIIRRELSLNGKNRVFINGQLVTQGFLKSIGAFLVDIHGQGEQAALYDVENHIELLDDFAAVETQKEKVAAAFTAWSAVKTEIASLEKDTAEKLQLLDILRFQTSEIRAADLQPGEDAELEEEKLRLNNVEKLTSLSGEAFDLLYDDPQSTAVTLEKAERKISELSAFESRFAEYAEGLKAARAVIDDLASEVRGFRSHLEFSPERLNEIEDRLAEITRLKRKYGDSIDAVLEHLAVSESRLQNIETAEFREEELNKKLAELRAGYVQKASELNKARKAAALKFEKTVEESLKAVAMENARFEVRIEAGEADSSFTTKGFDAVEFYFSANPGESPKPLVRVASGGEASRLMLVVKTVSHADEIKKTSVFDEVDVGIGGRVAEAVGRKLKSLAATQQVLCVTHQPQIASLADHHFIVEKETGRGRTFVKARALTQTEQVEEIARMLAGEQITDQARENARVMLASAK